MAETKVKDFISDEEMEKLFAGKDFISDEEMMALEPAAPSGPGVVEYINQILGAKPNAPQPKNLEEALALDPEKAEETLNTAMGFVGHRAGDVAFQGLGGLLSKAPGVQTVKSALQKAGAKVGEMLTGVPEQEIRTYAKHAPEIKAMAQASDNSTAEAADDIRKRIAERIKGFKGGMNAEIDSVLKQAPESFRQDVTPIVEALERQKARYNANANPEAIRAIDSLIDRVMRHTPGEISRPVSGPIEVQKGYNPSSYSELMKRQITRDSERFGERVGQPGYKEKPHKLLFGPEARGKIERIEPHRGSGGYVNKPVIDKTVGATDLNRIKQMLQDVAEKSYASPGEIFSYAGPAAHAAKSGAAEARGLLSKEFPAIAKANEKLSRLHEWEDLHNANLIAAGKPEAALLSAGTGGNPRNVKALRELGELVDMDMLGEAQKLAAMRTFGSPKLMPADLTGKSMARLTVGGGLGYLMGDETGAAAGLALTSPMALRGLIDAGRMAGQMAGRVSANPRLNNLAIRGLLNEPLQPAPLAPLLTEEKRDKRKIRTSRSD